MMSLQCVSLRVSVCVFKFVYYAIRFSVAKELAKKNSLHTAAEPAVRAAVKI